MARFYGFCCYLSTYLCSPELKGKPSFQGPGDQFPASEMDSQVQFISDISKQVFRISPSGTH